MKKIAEHCTRNIFGIFLMMCSLWACSDNNSLTNEPQDEPTIAGNHTCVLYFNGQPPQYNDETNTRATSTWADQSKIYLSLDTDNGKVKGTATYTKSSNSWTFNYYGTLNVEKESQCTAHYIENGTENNAGVQLSAMSVVYEDTKAQYIYSGNTLSISANLRPKTGRIRFKGEEKDTIFVKGITHYTYYDFGSTSFNTSNDELFLTTSSEDKKNYYTPYIYGYFTDEKNPSLQVSTLDQVFKRSFSASIFKAGESGYLTLPRSSSFTNWTSINPFFNLNYSASATQVQKDAINKFIDNMVKVEGGAFWMGAQKTNSEGQNYDSKAYSDESPVHQVVLAPFYMAKYEVTGELYNAIMGESSSFEANYPIYSTTTSLNSTITAFPSNLNTFITTLNSLTGLKFDIPTEEEWEYAARGGRKTHYYAYAGSNTLSDITYTGGGSRSVGSYTANELGIYDMTGNICELCYYRGNYTEQLIVNPKATTTYCGRGGYYNDVYYGNGGYARVTNRTIHYSRFYPGLRLILRITQ